MQPTILNYYVSSIIWHPRDFQYHEICARLSNLPSTHEHTYKPLLGYALTRFPFAHRYRPPDWTKLQLYMAIMRTNFKFPKPTNQRNPRIRTRVLTTTNLYMLAATRAHACSDRKLLRNLANYLAVPKWHSIFMQIATFYCAFVCNDDKLENNNCYR